jgi:hypothetical protein
MGWQKNRRGHLKVDRGQNICPVVTGKVKVRKSLMVLPNFIF